MIDIFETLSLTYRTLSMQSILIFAIVILVIWGAYLFYQMASLPVGYELFTREKKEAEASAGEENNTSEPASTFLAPKEQKVAALPLGESSSSEEEEPSTPSGKKGFSSFVNPSSSSNKKYQIVLARYQENVNFVLTSYFKDFDIVIYNKGEEIPNKDVYKRCTVIDLPNVGKCDHTYLYHIIENYDKLYDVTIFLPASFYYLHYKRFRAMQILKQVQDTGNSVYPCEKIFHTDINYSRYKDIRKNKYILDLVYYLKFDYYQTAYVVNRNDKVDREMLHSPLRPFHKWYTKHFPNKKCPYVFYWGIFAASRQDIRKNTLSFYKELCAYMDHHPNPEVGHYMERSWASVFYPFKRNCILQTK